MSTLRSPRQSALRAALRATTAIMFMVLAGCGAPASPATSSGPSAIPANSAASTPVTTTALPSAPQVGEPVGIIAIGHSGLNGEGTVSGPAISWATGTVPDVNSVYQRLVVVVPETEGHVANEAISGSRASSLEGQAGAAFAIVPAPALVIIQTLDNDIMCAVDEDPHVATFSSALSSALEMITEASPKSVILVVSSFGRPARWAALFADRPDIRAFVGGPGRCDMFDSSGTLVPEKVDRLTTLIERYEAEVARVCEAVPQCRTDDGLFTTYVETLEAFVPDDWGHLKAGGHTRLAELIWPKVMEVLGLP